MKQNASSSNPQGMRLLTTTEAARLLNLSPDTIKDWRIRPARYGPRPPYIRIGRVIRYNWNDLLEFLKTHTMGRAG